MAPLSHLGYTYSMTYPVLLPDQTTNAPFPGKAWSPSGSRAGVGPISRVRELFARTWDWPSGPHPRGPGISGSAGSPDCGRQRPAGQTLQVSAPYESNLDLFLAELDLTLALQLTHVG